MDLTRGDTQFEADANFANDSLSGANVVSKQLDGALVTATVAGTVMESEGNNADEEAEKPSQTLRRP